MNTDKKPAYLDVEIGKLSGEQIRSRNEKILNILSNDKMDQPPPIRQATAVRRGTKTDGKVKIKSRRKSRRKRRRKSTVNKKLSKYQIKKLSRKRTSVKKTKK